MIFKKKVDENKAICSQRKLISIQRVFFGNKLKS